MSYIVLKFGGTSVGTIERIRKVALRIKKEVDAGHHIAVVVSAMSGVTNELVGYARQLSPYTESPEYDVIVSAGEQITCGLLSMALNDIGVRARSWLGWQLPILTHGIWSKAVVRDCQIEKVRASLDDGCVAVIAGFQGVAADNRISTLGRGGSDTTAVAIAAALKAERCDILTDIDGIYTSDPRMIPTSKLHDMLCYEEALELASQGSKVLQTRSVELAMRYNVPVRVLSSFVDGGGTWVVNKEKLMEVKRISGLTCHMDEAKITLYNIDSKAWQKGTLFKVFEDYSVMPDLIMTHTPNPGNHKHDISFTVHKNDLDRAVTLLQEHSKEIGFSDYRIDSNIAKISIIGMGLRSHPHILSKLFNVLESHKVQAQDFWLSEIRLTVLVPSEDVQQIALELHNIYELDK